MKRAHCRNAVNTQKFYTRKNIRSRCEIDENEIIELDLNSIFNGDV